MTSKKRVLLLFGTRPEAIKMAPIALALKESKDFTATLVVTGQHREMLHQALAFFGLKPDLDLDLMKPGQDLFHITTSCLDRLRTELPALKPDAVLVQGDTTTAFAAALAAFYLKIPVAHVEAGLRTHDRYSPFPEELNRRMITPLANIHFAPTRQAQETLLREGVDRSTVYLTGNTSIDALKTAVKLCPKSERLAALYGSRTPILMTAHRRENFGAPLIAIFRSVKKYALAHPDFHVIYPVHPNPNVKGPAREMLSGLKNVSLTEPLDYAELVFLLAKCQFVLTDSGGLQEEAPALGKPVLVLRDSTERPEAVEAGCSLLVGCHEGKIQSFMSQLSNKGTPIYRRMSQTANPYGDGTAALAIQSALETWLGVARPIPVPIRRSVQVGLPWFLRRETYAHLGAKPALS